MNRAQGVLGTTVPAALLAPQGWAGPGCFTCLVQSESDCCGVIWLLCFSCWLEYSCTDEHVCVSGASQGATAEWVSWHMQAEAGAGLSIT